MKKQDFYELFDNNAFVGNINVAGQYTQELGWKDLIGDVGGSVKNANPPTWTQFHMGHWGWQFSVGDQIWLNFHVPHDWAVGTNLYPHVHWSCNTVGSIGKRAKWGFEYSIATRSIGLHSFNNANTVHVEAQIDAQWDHLITEVTDVDSIPGNLVEVDSIITMRAFRETASVNDLGALADSPFLFYVDLHYQTDRISTLNKEPNFYV